MEKRQIVSERAVIKLARQSRNSGAGRSVDWVTNEQVLMLIKPISSASEVDLELQRVLAQQAETLTRTPFGSGTRLDELDAFGRDLTDQQTTSTSSIDSTWTSCCVCRSTWRNQNQRSSRQFYRHQYGICGSNWKSCWKQVVQLVVDTSATAQFLLKNKCLKRNVTMIPLDKIRSAVDPRKVQLGIRDTVFKKIIFELF